MFWTELTACGGSCSRLEWFLRWRAESAQVIDGDPSLGPAPTASPPRSRTQQEVPKRVRTSVQGASRRRRASRRATSVQALAGGDDHRLDGGGHLVGDFDHDHVRPGVADRLLEVDLAPVDSNAASVADRVGDVLGGDRAE